MASTVVGHEKVTILRAVALSIFIYSVGDYMMPQVDRGLVMWQVQADWQYWRTV